MDNHLAESASRAAHKEVDALQLKHAKQQARRYIAFAKASSGGNAARYTMEEYLRMQGVRADLISVVSEPLKRKFNLRESYAA